ncbi:MAG: hypothetical protein QMD04_14860, partial [Anaerolineales bacterium]|nr:hypothetical protein [Anaerolineales bacterium]
MNNYVKIFDTTLRDGEQSPGATMTSAEKLELARSLARMGVDIIEAGFPAASPDDLEAVRRIAVEVGNLPKVAALPAPVPQAQVSVSKGAALSRRGEPVETLSKGQNDARVPIIAGLARANKSDIDKAWEAVKDAQKPRVHTFLA